MLVEHAKRELELAGLFDKDSDYNGGIGEAALEIVEIFAKQRHSGGSASMTISIVSDLMRFKPLTPLTSNADEWLDISEASGEPMWQSKRQPSCFSKDDGKTWHDLDAPNPPNKKMKSEQLTATHLQFIEIEKKKAEYKQFSEQLKEATEKLVAEQGVGHTFQDADGIVYKTVVPEGTFVSFKKFDVVRTRREGEVKGSLSMKEAKEAGFEV